MTTHIQNNCQAERNFSALAHLIGDLRSNMLASKVERMMFIRLNKHLVVTRSTSWTPRSLFRVNISRHSIITLVSWYCFFFLFCSCVLHEAAQFHEIGKRSFACWFCLDFSLEIAAQTNRSKGMHKGDRRKEVCRLFGRRKPMHIAS